MTTERQHAYDPDTLDDGTVVGVVHPNGNRTAVFMDRGDYQWSLQKVGVDDPHRWNDGRIACVFAAAEVWEPLPDGPTEEHVGRKVKWVRDDIEHRGRIGEVSDGGCVSTSRGWRLGFTDDGEWSVLVEPEPTDPDAALRRKVADILWRDTPSTRDVAERAACAVIAAVREAGEQV